MSLSSPPSTTRTAASTRRSMVRRPPKFHPCSPGVPLCHQQPSSITRHLLRSLSPPPLERPPLPARYGPPRTPLRTLPHPRRTLTARSPRLPRPAPSLQPPRSARGARVVGSGARRVAPPPRRRAPLRPLRVPPLLLGRPRAPRLPPQIRRGHPRPGLRANPPRSPPLAENQGAPVNPQFPSLSLPFLRLLRPLALIKRARSFRFLSHLPPLYPFLLPPLTRSPAAAAAAATTPSHTPLNHLSGNSNPPPPPQVLFYCHFPDLLLASRTGRLRALYRAPLDWLEEASTGMARAGLEYSLHSPPCQFPVAESACRALCFVFVFLRAVARSCGCCARERMTPTALGGGFETSFLPKRNNLPACIHPIHPLTYPLARSSGARSGRQQFVHGTGALPPIPRTQLHPTPDPSPPCPPRAACTQHSASSSSSGRRMRGHAHAFPFTFFPRVPPPVAAFVLSTDESAPPVPGHARGCARRCLRTRSRGYPRPASALRRGHAAPSDPASPLHQSSLGAALFSLPSPPAAAASCPVAHRMSARSCHRSVMRFSLSHE